MRFKRTSAWEVNVTRVLCLINEIAPMLGNNNNNN